MSSCKPAKPYFGQKSSCGSCPYRKDAPLRLWDTTEFADLLENDKDIIGKAYLCHKNTGSGCVGFLMNQVERDIPCNAVRIELIRSETPWSFLETLSCKSERYATIEEMAQANYPETFPIQ